MDGFLNRYNISKLNQEQINYLNGLISHKETEEVNKKSSKPKEAQGQMDLVQNSTSPSKKS